jgi:hypothetical protein
LEGVFGESSQEIINLAYYSICEGKAFYLYKDWSELAFISGDSGDMNSQGISKFLKELGQQEVLRERFLQRWLQSQKDIKE